MDDAEIAEIIADLQDMEVTAEDLDLDIDLD